MPGPDDAEVAAVERQDARDLQPFSDGRDGGVHEVEARFRVSVDDVSGAVVVGWSFWVNP